MGKSETIDQERTWKIAIANTQKMFKIAQELWLTLNSAGEACMRVAVELICDHKTRKAILQQTDNHTDEAMSQMEKMCREKLKVVMNQIRPSEGEKQRIKDIEGAAQERAAEDAKEIMTLREERDNALYRAETAEKELKRINSNEAAAERRSLRDAMGNDSVLQQQLKVQTQQMKELKKNYKEFEDTLQSLRDETAAARREAQDLRGLNDALNQSNRDLERRLDAAEKRALQLQDQEGAQPSTGNNNNLAAEKEELKKKVFTLERTIGELERALRFKENEPGTNEKCKKCEELQARLAKHGRQSQILQDNLDATTAAQAATAAEVEPLKAEVKSLRKSLQDVQEAQAAVAVVKQKVAQPSPELVEDKLKEERSQWAKERARLLEENAALQATEHELRAALDELRLRLQKLSEMGKQSSAAAQIQDLLQRTGLNLVVDAKKPHRVWDRLYNDFWERMKRLEEARQRARKANEEHDAQYCQLFGHPGAPPSVPQSRDGWTEFKFVSPREVGEDLPDATSARGTSPQEPWRPPRLVRRPAIGVAEKHDVKDSCLEIKCFEIFNTGLQEPSPMRVRMRPPRRPSKDSTSDKGQDKGSEKGDIVDQMQRSGDWIHKPGMQLQRSQPCFPQPRGWSPRDNTPWGNPNRRSQSCMRGVGSNSRESSRDAPLRKSDSEPQIDDAFRIQPRPSRRPRLGQSSDDSHH